GRTPANYLMAKYISQAFFVDIQFFINSESFRYKRPVAQLCTALDTVESEIYKQQYAVTAEKIVELGSPSINLNLRYSLLKSERAADYQALTGLGSERRILVVGQPIEFSLWYPLLDALNALVQSDRRYVATIKLHPQNSHGTTEVFKSRLDSSALPAFRFLGRGDIYPLLKSHDVVIGWSSNSMIEAGSLRKGVYMIETPFVSKFMSRRTAGTIINSDNIRSTLNSFFEDRSERERMLKMQNKFFEKNPEMDAMNGEHNFSARLLEAITTAERR
ncbi:hypothetical protein, partial [Fodinicurvata sp. EGI_FJ10296]|uniref:hypothetical protein n=1 Tax=Fodinicurvata sp. EGI_FJ10296 TaxID=3231908 RepID=UPI0034511BF0